MSLTVLLVLCLVATGLFAGSFRVGADLGWGFDIYKAKYTGSEKQNGYDVNMNLSDVCKNNGFAMNLVGEYDFTENWGVKASIGMMFAGKANRNLSYKATISSNGVSQTLPIGGEGSMEASGSDKSGIYFDFAVDGKYNYDISDKLSLSGLAGVEMLLGNVFDDKSIPNDSKKYIKNFAFGANVGAEVSYMVIENLRINGGVTAAWFFVNTCNLIKAESETETIEGLSVKKTANNSFYIRPYLGATYAF